MKAGETADGCLIKRYTDWVEMKPCYDRLSTIPHYLPVLVLLECRPFSCCFARGSCA